MNNLRPLRPSDISPAVVLQSLNEGVADFEQLYVVAITKDGPALFTTGNLSGLALAALCLQDMAMQYLNGNIDDEEFTPEPEGA